MSFSHDNAYVGPFFISVGSGKSGAIQRFRYPVPVKNLNEHLTSRTFILSGRMHLSWSSGSQFDRELTAGGSFTEDAAVGRPLMLDEELSVRSQGDSCYIHVAPTCIEHKLMMRRLLLQHDEPIEVRRYDLVVTAASENVVVSDGRNMPPGPRMYYGRTRGLELRANGPVACAVFSLLD